MSKNMLLLKVGGGAHIHWEHIAEDLKTLNKPVIIVHGANAQMKELSEKLEIKEKMITSPSGHVSRYTDEQTIELLTMVYSGLMNKKIVSILQKHGIPAVGLSGADGKLWKGKRKDAILSVENGKTKLIKDSQTGNVETVNKDFISLLLDHGYIPVLTIPAITESGELINVDNDRAVSIMVRDVGIETVIMLFEAPGLLQDLSDEGTRIKEIDKNTLDQYIEQTSGRMRKKMLGVKEAFSHGAKQVYFGDGRIKRPITKALEGEGTVIK